MGRTERKASMLPAVEFAAVRSSRVAHPSVAWFANYYVVLGAVKGPTFEQKGPTFRLGHGTQRQNWKVPHAQKGAARFARRAFFDGVGPSNSAFVCRGTDEKLDLFGRKLDL